MNILITGGTGLIGRHLESLLSVQGHTIKILSRHADGVNTFTWNIPKKQLDERALLDTDAIIHLAGANLGDKRWSEARKKEIIDSRVKSAELIFEKLSSLPHRVKVFLSASGTGYYGDTGDRLVDENEEKGRGFLPEVCEQWENAVKQFASIDIRTVIFRQGVVLDEKEGALPRLVKPVKFFVGSPLGSGKQYMPWIHIKDICGMYIHALTEDSIHGVYNAVADDCVTNAEVTRAIANILHRPVLPFGVPEAALKIILGEMGTMVVEGQKVSNKKLHISGFQLQFPELKNALKNLLT